jgi:hypothetical protein
VSELIRVFSDAGPAWFVSRKVSKLKNFGNPSGFIAVFDGTSAGTKSESRSVAFTERLAERSLF